MKFRLFAAILIAIAASWTIAVPGNAQQMLDAFHIPTDTVPYGGNPTMRSPLYPVSLETVYFYLGAQPTGDMTGGSLFVSDNGGVSWTESTLDPDQTVGNVDYWLTSIITPDSGGILYYFVTSGVAGYDTTYVYGDDDNSFTTTDQGTAQSQAFSFIVTSVTPTQTPFGSVTPEPTVTAPVPTSTPTATPTQTPTPEFPTPTPNPTTPTAVPPSQTPSPTNTPAVTPPTATPVTPTPSSPTLTPTGTVPASSPTPTAVPTLPQFELDLVISQEHFTGGEQFLLVDYFWNRSGVPLTGNLFVLLDVYGLFFFWPSWSQELDYFTTTVNPSATTPSTYVILDFPWTEEDVGRADNILIYSAVMSPDSTVLYGNVDYVSFGWE